MKWTRLPPHSPKTCGFTLTGLMQSWSLYGPDRCGQPAAFASGGPCNCGACDLTMYARKKHKEIAR